MNTAGPRLHYAAAALALVVTSVTAQDVRRAALAGSAAVEQTAAGERSPLAVLESFDGLGHDLAATNTTPRNPSDNSLAVGPHHIVQTVNSQLAVFTRRGTEFDVTGRVAYGPVPTHAIFAGFGEVCGSRPNGDAVVRYDQLARRWLVVMPIFRRAVAPAASGPLPLVAPAGEPARSGQASSPGPSVRPGTSPPIPPPGGPPPRENSYAICYAISAGDDPLGAYHRYVFERALFPDYPRPAVWPDGYYVATSTGDDVVQKHVCVVERARMLEGQPAREQCLVIDGVNFLNPADLEGQALPPPGAPNIVMATGGTQLEGDIDDAAIYAWNVHVDWERPVLTEATGPTKIDVAPYRYLCGGQLTSCVPQPGTDRRLDAQGDKIMARVIYRNLSGRESIVAVHSVDTVAGGGGVRWYEFQLDATRRPRLVQQSTYAPDDLFRWMASPAVDRQGNLVIGYSHGGPATFAGQRVAARLSSDPPGLLTFHESVLATGEAAQTNTLRWQDYTQTAIDPLDDCTIWYVGDYVKAGASTYSTRIGSFRVPTCH